MVNEKVEGREMTWRTLFPWTELFRGFQVALDLNKLLLAAAGIVVMAFGWWVLAWGFGSIYSTKPDWPQDYISSASKGNGDINKGWQLFKHDRKQWNLMHEAANVSGPQMYEPQDLANSPDELLAVRNAIDEANAAHKPWTEAIDKLTIIDQTQKNLYKDKLGKDKPGGTLSTWPWMEDRGPNPFLLATGQLKQPWEKGQFWDWLFNHQLLVVLEPVVKMPAETY